ncbi:MAG TPA: MFS transporter [Negativicutes bacterium]|nr:MFS transporter [Negativicutes bacterium]
MTEWKRNLLIMWFVQFAGMFAISAVFAFIPLYVRHLGIEQWDQVSLWSGLLASSSAIFAAISSPLWGNMADRYGRRIMVIRVMLANTFILSTMGFVANVWQLLGLRILQGIFGGFGGAVMALVTTLTPPDKLGTTLGLMQAALIAGSAAGPLAGGIIADHWGFRAVFFILGAMSFTAGLAAVLIREQFQPPAKEKSPSFGGNIRQMCKEPGLLPLIFVLFLIQFAVAVPSPVLPLFVEQLGASSDDLATIAGGIIAIAGLSSALSAASTGRITHFFSHRTVLLSAAACAAVIIFIQGLAQSTGQLFWLRFLNGLFLGSMLPTANTLISLLIPAERRGAAFGLTHSATLLGNVLGPVTGGLLASFFNIRWVFFFTAFFYVANCIWIYHRVRRRHDPPEAGQH